MSLGIINMQSNARQQRLLGWEISIICCRITLGQQNWVQGQDLGKDSSLVHQESGGRMGREKATLSSFGVPSILVLQGWSGASFGSCSSCSHCNDSSLQRGYAQT